MQWFSVGHFGYPEMELQANESPQKRNRIFCAGDKIDLITRQPAARRIYRGDRCVVGSQQYTDRPCRPLGKR